MTYRGLRDSVLAHFATLAAHQTSARVVEALLKNAAAEEYVEVYERHIAPQFMDLACSWGLGATFVVQAVIQNAQAPEHLEAVLGHLTHGMRRPAHPRALRASPWHVWVDCCLKPLASRHFPLSFPSTCFPP